MKTKRIIQRKEFVKMHLDSLLDSILTTPLTFSSLLLCFGSALVLGLLTALVFTRGCRHTASFALTLTLLPMSVAMVIMMVNGSIGTGLAVAGTFALVRFRSLPGTAREIAAIFTAVALGLALGMGMLGVAVIFFLLSAVATLVLTALHFGAAPENEKLLRITVPEDLDYETAFTEVFAAHHVKAKLERVKLVSMGTLFELTWSVKLPGHVPEKALVDDLRERNSNLPILFTAPGEKESL